MIRRVLALCLLISILCLQVMSETTNDASVGLQIGNRFISGPVILNGGNETVIIDKYTLVKSIIISDEGVFIESYPTTTTISILPEHTQLNEIGTFSVRVHVSPSQPIKGVEINMSFNPSCLRVVDVTQGYLFGSYPTFYVVNNIDNDKGFLVAYELIIGQGNTTDDGNFINITFNAIAQGTTSLAFHTAGITNETQYVELLMENATVYVAYPWDIVPDRIINYVDLSSFVTHYRQSGGLGWIRDDINDDGMVNYKDLSALATHYREVS